jgi:hypothetical protein
LLHIVQDALQSAGNPPLRRRSYETLQTATKGKNLRYFGEVEPLTRGDGLVTRGALTMNYVSKLAAVAAMSAFSLTFVATPADAQGRNRQTTVSNDAGRSATATRDIDRSNGVRTKTGSVETAQGYGASRTVTNEVVSETGAVNRSGTITTNSGATVSSGSSASCQDGVCTRETTITGPNGQSATGSKALYVDENGNLVKEAAVMGPEGQTASRSVIRSGEGEKTTTRSNAQGETSTRTRWIEVEKN